MKYSTVYDKVIGHSGQALDENIMTSVVKGTPQVFIGFIFVAGTVSIRT